VFCSLHQISLERPNQEGLGRKVKIVITYEFQWDYLKGRDHMGDEDRGGIIILKWIYINRE
jgi:hypothetical protein